MKMLIAAVALTIASPAFAQAADPHAGHHQGHGTSHEQHKSCCEGKDAGGSRKECCEKMKDGKAMECCAKQDTKRGPDAHVIQDKHTH